MKTAAPAPRSFSSAGRVSRRTLVGGALVAAALVATVVAAERLGPDDEEDALAAARHVLAAASSYRGEEAGGCPTLTGLVRAGRLESDARTDDAWGGRFRIVCEASAIEVRSPGRDGRAGTADDLRVEGRPLGS